MDMGERMELNAAIEKLIALPEGSPGWLEPARIVVTFGSKIPKSNHYAVGFIYRKTHGSSSGYTTEAGNVTIRDEKPEVTQKTLGSVEERVGNYKLWHFGDIISIRHFWKADTKTESEPTWFLLGYNPKTLEPEGFGEVRQEERRVFWFFWLRRLSLSHLQGRLVGTHTSWTEGVLVRF